MSKYPAILFPDRQTTSAISIYFTKKDLSDLCNLKPFTSLTRDIGNLAVKRSKTKQMELQYSAMKEAVDAEYTELENQAYIHYQQLTEQLGLEFKSKIQLLDKELKKAEAEAEMAYLEHKTNFEKYIQSSSTCRNILEILKDSAAKINEIIKVAEKDEITRNNKHYVKLCEQYRQLMRGIVILGNLIS